MSTRQPNFMQTMMYGGPPAPIETVPLVPVQPTDDSGLLPWDDYKVNGPKGPAVSGVAYTPPIAAEPRKLRCVAHIDGALGELRLKVYLDGVLLYEAGAKTTTVSVETTV